MPPEQARFFDTHGYLRLTGFYPKASLRPLSKHVLAELKRLKLWAAGKAGSRSLQSLPVFQQITKVSNAIDASTFQKTLVTSELLAAMRELTGGPLAESGFHFLISLPNQGHWSLNRLNWHVDVNTDSKDRLPGVQAFVLIDDVVPHGGATLALAGSHRPETRSAVREVLKSEDDLEPKLAKLEIQVVEMSGRAGDLILMDLRLLHAPSINASRNVRMMATARFFA